MKMLLSILSLIVVVCLDTAEAYGCPDSVMDLYRGDGSLYGAYGDLCIRYQLLKKLGYTLAREDCNHLRGSLVMPKTKEFNEYLAKKLAFYLGDDNVWIGLDDRQTESKFAWQDGTELDGLGFFGTTEGFNHAEAESEDCVTLRSGSKNSFHWEDDKCNTAFLANAPNKHYYVCQYPASNLG